MSARPAPDLRAGMTALTKVAEADAFRGARPLDDDVTLVAVGVD